jgi:hypothetical protein
MPEALQKPDAHLFVRPGMPSAVVENGLSQAGIVYEKVVIDSEEIQRPIIIAREGRFTSVDTYTDVVQNRPEIL